MDPLISVIVPVLNGSRYLDRFIYAMERQIYTHWELIIVDDQSTDDSVRKARTFSDRDNRISVYNRSSQPNGACKCRNIGLTIAKGKYFVFFDIDDLITANCLYQRVMFLESHPGIDYAVFPGYSVEIVDQKLRWSGGKWGFAPHQKDLLRLFLSTNYPYSVWSLAFRSKTMKGIIWDEDVKIYTDFSYIFQILVNKELRFVFAENVSPDYYYCTHNQNSMTSDYVSRERYLSTKDLFDKVQKDLASFFSKTLLRKYKRAFYKFYRLEFVRLLKTGQAKQVEDFISFTSVYYPKRKTVGMQATKVMFEIAKYWPAVGKFILYLYYDKSALLKYPLRKLLIQLKVIPSRKELHIFAERVQDFDWIDS